MQHLCSVQNEFGGMVVLAHCWVSRFVVVVVVSVVIIAVVVLCGMWVSLFRHWHCEALVCSWQNGVEPVSVVLTGRVQSV